MGRPKPTVLTFTKRSQGAPEVTPNGLSFTKRKSDSSSLFERESQKRNKTENAPLVFTRKSQDEAPIRKASTGGGGLQFQKTSTGSKAVEMVKKVIVKPSNTKEPPQFAKRSWSASPPPPPAVINPVIGTCRDIEKEYHRGEGNVEPDKVRPYAILEKSFQHVKTNAEERGYKWSKNQLKSIRQDLLVQDVRDVFTWNVYEHAAMEAIKNRDAGELTQTLAHLRRLESDVTISEEKLMEVAAYRILFHTLRDNFMKVDEDIALLPSNSKSYSCIEHALTFSIAYSSNNFFKLRELVENAPNAGRLVIDIFLPSLRSAVYRSIISSYDVLSVPSLLTLLWFPSHSGLKQFLKQNGARPTANKDGILCRESLAAFTRLTSGNYNPQFADLQT